MSMYGKEVMRDIIVGRNVRDDADYNKMVVGYGMPPITEETTKWKVISALLLYRIDERCDCFNVIRNSSPTS